MPARRSALYLCIALLLQVTSVAAQAPNPHTAIPAPQQQNRPGTQQAPANLRPASAPTQTGFPPVGGNPTSSGGVAANQANSQVPQVPLLPSQMPPKPPRVSYAGGQLTVVADNSTMGDILNAVRSATGIKIEGTSGGGDRVYGQYGPASPRVILDSLLSGSHYDFIILSSLDNPEAVQRVILSPRGNSPPASVNASNQPRPFNRPPADEDNDTTPDEVTNEQPMPVAPPQGMQQPGQPQTPGQQQTLGQPQTVVPVPINGQSQAQQQPNATPQGVKTPEQLLEELRRLNGNPRRNDGEGPRTPQQPPDIVPR